jgi:hypothetical protein
MRNWGVFFDQFPRYDNRILLVIQSENMQGGRRYPCS